MWRNITSSLVLNVIIALVAIAGVYSAISMVRDALVLKNESRDIQSRIHELESKKSELEQYLTELQTEEAIEREAKERFNVKKPGEEVVVVIPQKKEEASVAVPPTLWKKIKAFFDSR